MAALTKKPSLGKGIKRNGISYEKRQISSPNLASYFNLNPTTPIDDNSNTNLKDSCLQVHDEPECNLDELDRVTVDQIFKTETVYDKVMPYIENRVSKERFSDLKKLISTSFKNLDSRSTNDKAMQSAKEEREIGSGASGSVYLTSTKSNSSPIKTLNFAIKKFPKVGYKETEQKYFQNHAYEIYLSCCLEHKNIVRCHKAIYDESRFQLVLEYLPYDYFDQVLSNKLSKHEINIYFLQLCDGVQYLHSNGIVHRDLKLDNLMIDFNRQLKIVDFGFATVLKNSQGVIEQSKGLWGSDPYMAPEMFSNTSGYDGFKSDIWSIAIVYLASHSGRFPWDVAKPEDYYFSKFSVNKSSIDELIEDNNARPLIHAMLECDPAVRFDIHQVLRSKFFDKVRLNFMTDSLLQSSANFFPNNHLTPFTNVNSRPRSLYEVSSGSNSTVSSG